MFGDKTLSLTTVFSSRLSAMNQKNFPDFSVEDGFRAPQTHFIDNIVYDGREPNKYLEKFSIGLKGKDKV
ncbi:hypothetical protein UG53_09480 [Vibrio sp. S512-13]|nr:hypothetical protein UG53_09480 [Vibrio sp. S512-13]